MTKTPLTVRIAESEMERLKAYCAATGRTQTDVIRELIRKLRITEKPA
ncbi:MAG: ribbon-helix-helix protein, CopG family [Cyanophyceae cyanobacterium]